MIINNLNAFRRHPTRSSLFSTFLKLPRSTKRILVILSDIFLLFSALWISFSLRLETIYIPDQFVLALWFSAVASAIIIFVRMGLYRSVIRYIGFKFFWVIFQAVSIYSASFALLMILTNLHGVPRSALFINWFVCLILIASSRIVARWWFSYDARDADYFPSKRKNVLIYGAGSAGIQLAVALSYSKELKPIAFIDDDKDKQKQNINELNVYSINQLNDLIEAEKIQEILLAIPSSSRHRRHQIITQLEPLPVHVRTLPGVSGLAKGNVKIDDIIEVDIADLLGRDAVSPNQSLLHANIKNKVIMVTGAGGSIGSELCRQIIKLSPKNLILFEQSEYNLYALEKELAMHSKVCVPVLGSVVNQKRVEQVCCSFGVQTIYHAAAYKHVPMVEKNPAMGVKNNIFGTWHTAKAALNTGVETFVLISTDKAVRPTNVMGTTKRFAELILQAISQKSLKNKSGRTTRFTMVRFGNVLGSSGSVVPLFREQIKQGGPVTVTHRDIIRYFMTIPEASQLVIQAGAMGKGGDVFVLDMGDPVNIYHLAERMIRLSGFEVQDKQHPHGDIAIDVTGLRPGEKLYEELLIDDNVMGTKHKRIMRAEETIVPWAVLEKYLKSLKIAIEKNDIKQIRSFLLNVVKGYHPQCGIEDVIFLANIKKEKSIEESRKISLPLLDKQSSTI